MASVTVDVDLDEFGDDEIIEAAVEIIAGWRDLKEGSWQAKHLVKLRAALGKADAEVFCEGPRTTASRLPDFASLRQLVSEHPELYRFAGPPQ